MPVAFIDRLDDLEMVERNGAIRSLTRKARVVFLGEDERPEDYGILRAALAVVPSSGSTLPDDGLESLVLVERRPRVVEMDPSVVDVTLKYDHILDGPNQSLVGPTSGVLYGKGRCSIVEKPTNFYRVRGAGDRIQILTAHTFPEWETGIIGTPFDPKFPRTVFQGGEITIPFPQDNFQMQGVVRTNSPLVFAKSFVPCINEDSWLGGNPFTWLCSEASWELLSSDASEELPLYKFSFEFQYNIDTWDPTVVFNDHRTGRPPAGVEGGAFTGLGTDGADTTTQKFVINPYTLRDGNPLLQPAGYWTVPALKAVDFSALFAALFEA